MRKHGLKVLGLALMAALGLMAFSATSALAAEAPILNLGDKFYENNETVPEWLVKSGTLSPTGLNAEGLPITQAVKGKQTVPGVLEIPAKASEIVCATGEGTGTVANEYKNWFSGAIEQGAHAHLALTFKGCKTEEITAAGVLTGKTLTNCVPNPATTPGEILANVLLLGKKHKEPAGGTAKTHLVALPLIGSKAQEEAALALTASFTTIKFGELCALPPTVNVTGSVSFLAPTADAVKPTLSIDTLNKAEQELIGTKLKFGANEAFIKTTLEAELPANPGVEWGVM